MHPPRCPYRGNASTLRASREVHNKLYEWKTSNKMKFNGAKFQYLKYGHHKDIKDNTMYFTESMAEMIQIVSLLRDLGVIMSDDGKFEEHIQKVVSNVRQKVRWMLRIFYTKRKDIFKQLWKTLLQCHIDYCSQLYMPSQSYWETFLWFYK